MSDKNILYIEDNFHNRRIVRKILTSRGYHMIEAEDGETGLEMVRKSRPLLLLLDITLPGELDGMDVVAIMKSDTNLKHIPVIALTASAMMGDKERFLAGGCDDYLSKPIRASELLEKVDYYFSLAQNASEGQTL
jgi:two-component system cell cycle response regulator DivK